MAIKTVIDTSVLASALSANSTYYWLIEFLLEEKIELYVTEDILIRYEEILKTKYSASVAANFLLALKELPNVHFSQVNFRGALINNPDDNKFVDCYIASGADYLISHDAHFSLLKSTAFPTINVVRIEEFDDTLWV